MQEYEPPSLLASQIESFEGFISKSSIGRILDDAFPEMAIKIKTGEEDADPEGADVFVTRIANDNADGKGFERCISEGLTYKQRITVEYSCSADNYEKEHSIVLCDIPAMTPRGTFVVRGAERVFLHQLVQAPGVSFEWREIKGGGHVLKAARVVPDGINSPWLKFSVPDEGRLAGALVFSMWNKGEIPATAFFRACGVSFCADESDDSILGASLELEKSDLEKAGESATDEDLNKAAVDRIYAYIDQFGSQSAGFEEKREAIRRRFFGPEGMRLGEAGRASFKRILGACGCEEGEDRLLLNRSDLETLAKCFSSPKDFGDGGVFDSPYSLSGRRVLRSGDYLKRALESALSRRRRHIVVGDGKAVAGLSVEWQDTADEKMVPYEVVVTPNSGKRLQLHFRRGGDGKPFLFTKTPKKPLDVDVFLGSLKKAPKHDDGSWEAAVREVYSYFNLGKECNPGFMAQAIDDALLKSASFDLGRFGRDSFAKLLGASLQEMGNKSGQGEPKPETKATGNPLQRADIEAIKDFFEYPEKYEGRFSKKWPDASACMLALDDESAETTWEIEAEFIKNDLLQYLERCNILSGVSQKRRVSSFGPGGLTAGAFNDDIRLVERSHYGRLCPIETPEGQNVGVIANLAALAEIDRCGRITAPYVDLKNGNQSIKLPAEDEDKLTIASAFADSEGGRREKSAPGETGGTLSCRRSRRGKGGGDKYGELCGCSLDEVDCVDMQKGQMLSVSASLIPFLEHDDAHRALMGSNMQRQAIPLLYPQAPYVGTGMEARVVSESGAIPTASRAGKVEYADARRIVFKDGDLPPVPLPSLAKAGKHSAMMLRPSVKVDENVAAGQVLADGYSSDGGELALGANLLAAYMCWEGYNYEDGIVLSERVLEDDLLTSVCVHELALELRDVPIKGFDGTTVKHPERLRADMTVAEGERVRPGDVLASKISYIPKKKARPSDIFVRAVREAKGGRLSEEVLKGWVEKPYVEVDRPLTVPGGLSGIVIGVDLASERGDLLDSGVFEKVVVRVAQTRKVEVGDKLAGRHGNKGVISKIIPVHEMPCLADGTPVDIILNPLGVPSRLNVGQLYECALGWVAYWASKAEEMGKSSGGEASGSADSGGMAPKFRHPAFEGPSKAELDQLVAETNGVIKKMRREPFSPVMDEQGKVVLYDGRTGKPFRSPVAVGYVYMMKLDHMVQDKVHARSNGPRTQVECQPLKGRSRGGGQRLGDMESWALEGYGARALLREFFTTLSDTPGSELKLEKAISGCSGTTNAAAPADNGTGTDESGFERELPESTRVFLEYLRALCLKPTLEGRAFSISFDAKAEGIDERNLVRKSAIFDYHPRNEYEAGKPYDDGLFSETIFGSEEDRLDVRRGRTGCIKLAKAVKHPWFSSGEGASRKAEYIEGYGEATIEVLPVLPAEMRPLVAMADGSYQVSDINVLYRNVLMRNETIERLNKAVDGLVNMFAGQYSAGGENGLNEAIAGTLGLTPDQEKKRTKGTRLVDRAESALQLAVDQLLDNARCSTKAVDRKGRLYGSLTSKISGKQGIIRKRLLGKRVDYSGRSVIAPNPELGFDQCGLPFAMAKELFRPWLVAKLMKEGYDVHPCDGSDEVEHYSLDERSAAKLVDSKRGTGRKAVKKALEQILDGKVVLLNRSPTLHRMGIQAFRPVLNDGDEKVIRLHPLACSAFNADFDGDTMAMFVPLGAEAIKDAESHMLASANILSPAHGKPLAMPSQDMVVGLYWKTLTERGRTELFDEVWASDQEAGQPKDIDDAYPWRENLALAINRLKDGIEGGCSGNSDRSFEKTLGKLAIEKPLGKAESRAYVYKVCQAFREAGLSVSEAAPILNRLMWLGFKYSTISGLTVSYSDAAIDDSLQDKIVPLMRSYEEEAVEALLKSACEERRNELMEGASPADNSLGDKPLLAIADSGARGNLSHIRQVAALRGNMSGSFGESIETPIRHSLAEGMTPLEYWLSVYGSRREVMNTALGTAKSGEFARSLVNAVQDARVVKEDCGTDAGIDVPIEEIGELRGRYVAEDVVANGETLLSRNDVINDSAIASFLGKTKGGLLRTIKVRSPFTCASADGVCVRCYGWDLSKLKDVEEGAAVGIVAAQSMSEPATQLTLSTFHGGGTAGDSIIQGLPLITSVLSGEDAGKPAILAKYPSRVIDIDDLGNDRKVVTLEGESDGCKWKRAVRIDAGPCVVGKGDCLKPASALTTGIKPLDKILALEGRAAAGHRLIEELVDAYRSQGIDIDRRHLEVVAGEMIRRCGIEHEQKIRPAFHFRNGLAGDNASVGRTLMPGTIVAELRFGGKGEIEHDGIVKQVKLYDDRDGGARITISSVSKANCPSWAKMPVACEGKELAEGAVLATGEYRSRTYGIVNDMRETDDGQTEIVVSKASGHQELPAGCEPIELKRGERLTSDQTIVAWYPVYKKEVVGIIGGISDKKDKDGRSSYSISVVSSAGEKRVVTVTKKYELKIETNQKVDRDTVWASRPVKSKLDGVYLGTKEKDGNWVILVQTPESDGVETITIDAALDTCLVKKGDLILYGDLLTEQRRYRSEEMGIVERVDSSEGRPIIEIRKEKTILVEKEMVVAENIVPGELLKEGDPMIYVLSSTWGEIVDVLEPSGRSWPAIKYRGYTVLGYESLAQNPQSGSFLAAAAYRRTREKLTKAVLEGKADYLTGFKERLILGWPCIDSGPDGAKSQMQMHGSNEE